MALTSSPSSPASSVGSTFVRAPPGASLEGEGGRKEGRCEEAVSRAQNDREGRGLTSWQPQLRFPVPAGYPVPRMASAQAAWCSLGGLCTAPDIRGTFQS